MTGALELGGRYHIEGNASGTVTACVPQETLALTWEFGGAMSWVALTLSPDGTGTRLELEHIAPLNPHWEQYGPGAVGVGWDLSFLGLSRHLTEPDVNLPAEAAAGWETSNAAKSLVRTASDDWGQAAIAAGEDRAHALKAAEATRRFFSGEAPTED